MTTLTRHAHYAAMPRTSFRQPAWTVEHILVAYGLFVREEGALPVTVDCRGHQGLPTIDTICKLFPGGLAQLHALYRERYGALPAPPSHAATVTCLRCGEPYKSPDKREFRLHPRCREINAADDNHGLWMNGTPVLANGACDWFDTEKL